MSDFNRRLVYAILLYTCIEGLVVNLTFPSKIGYLMKDMLIAAAAGLLLADNSGRSYGSLGRLAAPLGAFAFVQIMYLLLSSDLPLLARLVGLKMRIFYVLLMYLGYRLIRSEQDFKTLGLVLAVSAVPVSLFGVYLYFQGPSALQAMGASYSAVITSTTGDWRVPGTFNSPGQYGLYLTFNSLIVLGLLLSGGLSARTRVLLWGVLGVMTIAALASGSRTPLVLTVAGFGAMTVSMGRVGRALSFGIVAYVIFAAAFATLGGGVEERFGSIASMEHVERFNRTYFGQMFIPKMLETPMGLGLGVATIGARHFTEFGQVILVESYFGIVAVETGVLGVVTFLWVSAAIVAYLLRGRAVMRYAPATAAWHAAGVFVMILVLIGPVSTPLDAAPGNVYFWLSLGVVARLFDLERERLAATLPQENTVPYYWPAAYAPPGV